jgi:hypothetical protein
MEGIAENDSALIYHNEAASEGWSLTAGLTLQTGHRFCIRF